MAKMGKNGSKNALKSTLPFCAATRRSWETPDCGFTGYSVHMLLLVPYPIWVRFFKAAEHPRKKRPFFHVFQKNEKHDFYKV